VYLRIGWTRADLWEKIWSSSRGSAEEVEGELDEEGAREKQLDLWRWWS
jgi:hypothetical protein